jgi:Tfp pilus assembly protein PilV
MKIPCPPGRLAAPQQPPAAFTLLEALLALLVFSTAVIALVGAINGTGQASVDARRQRLVQTRLESLLVEATRLRETPAGVGAPDAFVAREFRVEEEGVVYQVKIAPLELTNREGQALPQLMKVTAKAVWQDGGHEFEEEAETWMWPPLFTPQRRESTL